MKDMDKFTQQSRIADYRNRPAIKRAIKMAIEAMQHAHVAISNHRVGACVVATNKEGKIKLFTGCNIELATSVVYHAERVALTKAVSEGYPYILCCIVTSLNDDQQAAMCGSCMQDFMYANPNCGIVVVKPTGEIKLVTSVTERNGKYAYLGKGKLQI